MRGLATTGLVLGLISLMPAGVGAQDVSPSPPPRPVPSTAAEATAFPAEATFLPGEVEFESPSWSHITPVRGPAAREDHTWTVDGDGRNAYLFGGRDGSAAFADLWRFELETDTWHKLLPPGKGPAARFGHSAVWSDGHGLVVFAGQRDADFFGDLWAYDPDRDAWTELPANGAAPKARYGSCMIVGPDGRLWISHGFTFAGRFDDTRAYDLEAQRWAASTPELRRPGQRCLHDCFTSADGQLVLYGGQNETVPALGDLWLTRDEGTWRRLPDPSLEARRLYAVTESGPHAWLFGGIGRDDPLGDLWRIDRETLAFERIEVPGPSPSARYAGTLIDDADRGRLLLFGGRGREARADLWQLSDKVTAASP